MEISCCRHGEVLAKCLQFPRDARETQLRLLQDSLSVMHISPEEEADLMLALHCCTQGKRKFSLRRPEGRQPVLRPRSHVDPCRITHIFLVCFRCNFGSNWKYQSKEKRNKKSRKFRAPDRDPSPRGKDRKTGSAGRIRHLPPRGTGGL